MSIFDWWCVDVTFDLLVSIWASGQIWATEHDEYQVRQKARNWCRVGPVAFERRMKRKKKTLILLKMKFRDFYLAKDLTFGQMPNISWLWASFIAFTTDNREIYSKNLRYKGSIGEENGEFALFPLVSWFPRFLPVEIMPDLVLRTRKMHLHDS